MAKRRSKLRLFAEGSFSRAAVVFADVHVEYPVHRLDDPVATNRFAEARSAQVAAEDVIPHVVAMWSPGFHNADDSLIREKGAV